jgi:hypothetical protein
MNQTSHPVILSLRQISSWAHPELRHPDSPLPITASVPKLQRGLVWDPSQIELLWDSLLRGFPVGSLVVCPRIPGQDDGDDPCVSHHLLDGQQRANAISMAFEDPFAFPSESAEMSSRPILWIDLCPEIPSGSTRDYLVRCTTTAHPWGFRRSDNCPTLQAWQIRETLHFMGLNPSDPDYVRPHPRDLFPVEANCPVPMSWLMRLDPWKSEAFWKSLAQRCETSTTRWTENIMRFISDASDKAVADRVEVIRGFQRLHACQIVALSAPHSLIESTKAENSDMGTHEEISSIEHLFQRLNRQGTRLDGEELAYSMIKAYWPRVAKPIERIVLRRMPASRLVMLAARAALTPATADHLRGPLAVTDIRRMALTQNKEASRVLGYIEGPLKQGCEWIENAVLYHPQSNPGGLLPVHLASIARSNPEVYLLLLCLAERCIRDDQSGSPNEELRRVIIALACRLSWFASNTGNAVNHVHIACHNGVSVDAIRAAMHEAENEGWLTELPLPKELELTLDFEDDDIESWTWYTPIYGDGNQMGIDIRQRRWGPIFHALAHRERHLLLFAQRGFIARKFPDFDPSRRDLWEGHNRPWDFDHIHAQAYVYNKKSDNRYQRFVKQWLDTLGNLRAWPFEDNRSESSDPANSKIQSSEQLADSFLLPEELQDFSMERLPLSDEVAARRFANACRKRLVRIYGEIWSHIQ